MMLLRDLDAFYLDHPKCGDIRGGVEERGDAEVVRFECDCSAVRCSRPTDEAYSRTDVHLCWIAPRLVVPHPRRRGRHTKPRKSVRAIEFTAALGQRPGCREARHDERGQSRSVLK